MAENTEIPRQEIIQAVEQQLINEKWHLALDIWVQNAETLDLIRWLAKILFLSVSTESAVLLQDIMEWREDDDGKRRDIFKKSESLGFTTQAGALGLALFITGGSMSPPSCEPVYASRCAVKKILHGILINQSVITSEIPVEGAREVFRQWSDCHR